MLSLVKSKTGKGKRQNTIEKEPEKNQIKKPLIHGASAKIKGFSVIWWKQGGSNSRPYGCEPYALTN